MAVPAHPAPPLLGRLSEQETLRQLVANVRGGQSAVLVVRGEAGIGKTALLRYLTSQAPGFTVARAVGVESEMELAFAGLHQLCAPMLGRLGSPARAQRRALRVAFGLATGDAPDRFLVALAALSLLAEVAEEQPLLCVVDDAQWLDQASAQVARVRRAPPAGRVGRAGVRGARSGGAEPRTTWPACRSCGWQGWATTTRARCWRRSSPGPLDERVRDRIIAETRGNPLALLELAAGPGRGRTGRRVRAPGRGRPAAAGSRTSTSSASASSRPRRGS